MKKKGYITLEEREVISQMRYAGKSLKDIGNAIGRHKGVISRELKRNRHPKKKTYLPSIAHKLYSIRKSNGSKRKKLKSSELRLYVISKLMDFWSPEQIAGRIPIDFPGCSISHEAIYQFIYDWWVRTNLGDFTYYLRQARIKRRKKGLVRKTKRSNIPNRLPIELRPEEVKQRLIAGHWEGDSIVSSKSTAALSTLVERKTGYTKIQKLERKTAINTRKAIIKSLKDFPKDLRQTITFDNGCEFTQHETITRKTNAICYFANPYHSWERGTNENTNGLIRQFFPKGTDFKKVTKEQIQDAENYINTRPRKRLGFKTPIEKLEEELNLAA